MLSLPPAIFAATIVSICRRISRIYSNANLVIEVEQVGEWAKALSINEKAMVVSSYLIVD